MGACVRVYIDQLQGCSGTYRLYAILRPCWRAWAERVVLWVLRFWAFLPAVIQYQHRPMDPHSRSDDNIKLHWSSTELWLSLQRTPLSNSLFLSVGILAVCSRPPPVFLLGTLHPKIKSLSFSQPCTKKTAFFLSLFSIIKWFFVNGSPMFFCWWWWNTILNRESCITESTAHKTNDSHEPVLFSKSKTYRTTRIVSFLNKINDSKLFF